MTGKGAWKSADRGGWLARPVFVLGAGFSRAVSEYMPTTAQLRDELQRRLGVAVPDDVEAWLSYLASSQPFLDQSENYVNKALYFRASQHIARAIRAAAHRVRAEGEPPEWLIDFALMILVNEASVVTFNYDDLLERAVPELAYAPRSFGVGRRTVLKLHGSITESWDPQERGSFDGPSGNARGAGWDNDHDEPYRWLAEGRWEPFIVPPVQEKSALYDIAELRDRWLSAASRLREATSIIVLGYSLPPQDFSTHALLTRAATANVDDDLPDPNELCPLVGVADLDPAPVAARLRGGGVSNVRLLGSGEASIPDAVDRLSNEVWSSVAHELEVAHRELEGMAVEFEFGIGGLVRGGIAADLGVLGQLRTAAELVEAIEDRELDGSRYDDRIPVGCEVTVGYSESEATKVHVWLGGPR